MSATATTHEIPSGYTAVHTPSAYGTHLCLLKTPFGDFESWGRSADEALLGALRKARREDGS
jgi:hypothetical protein